MHTIAELNMLLRAQIELPVGLKLATVEFHEGWNFMRSGTAGQLKKKIQTRGWNFIKIADGLLRSGVGDTPQEAIASALKLALRRVNTHFNAAEVERIELTKYPWFSLARIIVYPYRIQQEAVLPVSDEAEQASAAMRPRRLPADADALLPHFGSAIPTLKELLVLSRSPDARIQ
jgi:hypothetical protein